MVIVMRFFRWVWQKITCWVLFWKQKTKSTVLEHPDAKKNVLKSEKFLNVDETLKLVESCKEAKVCKMEVSPMVAGPCALTETTDGVKVELHHGGQSLLRLPLMAVKSVSTIMVSALQSGWQMCSWKSSVSSTSVPSQVRTGSPLQSPEAEMLREVYLVLWAIRKQLRQLARRQERCRRRPICAHTCHQPDPVQGPKQNAQSPL